MSKLLIIDTADVTIKRKSDNHLFASAEAQLASISQSLGINEKIYGGIGNKALAIMKGQKDVTTTIRNAFYDKEFLAMTQGVSVEEDGAATIYNREKELTVVDNAGQLEVTITGTPVGTTAHVVNGKGETEQATLTEKVVAIPDGHAVAGEMVSVVYQESITGDIVELESDKFGEAFVVEYHTIGYDPSTNKVVKDIYIQLDHVVPNGDFELALENGTAIAPEFVFDCLTAPNSNKIGRIIEKDRI